MSCCCPVHVHNTATVPKYAWGAGIYFWMERTKATMGTTLTCHQASLVGSGSGGDFGGGLDVINGGLGTWCDGKDAWVF